MDYVIIHNKNPKSVYAFAKANNFEEQRFYESFSSFVTLEQSIFKIFFDNAHTALEKNEDYLIFDARNKLLSFYFTFFGILNENKKYIIYVLNSRSTSLNMRKTLTQLKQRFISYMAYLNIDSLEFKQEQLSNLQNRGIKKSAWLQLLITIKFWLNDTSQSSENTDLFIEKSVEASFDLIDVAPSKNLIDLGKFLFMEKMCMN
jgi:hypothetical protein